MHDGVLIYMQGDIYSYLHSQGGRLSEEVAVTLILEPSLSGLEAIHAQVCMPPHLLWG